MGNKLALTGITNNPGRVLVEYIYKNREIVDELFPGGIKAVYRASSNVSTLNSLLPDMKQCICDLTDINGLENAFQDVDTVLHMAGIHWSQEVFKAAASCGVRRIITVHTCGVYSKYKAAGETYRQIDDYCLKICKENNIRFTILRPTMIYGTTKDRNMIKFIKMVDKLPVMPVVNGGRYTIQPVHYRDLGKAFYDVLVNEKRTEDKEFVISGEKPIYLRDMFMEIGTVLGKKVHFVSCPLWIAYPGAWIVYLLSLRKIDFREKVQRLCEDRAFSHQDATDAFGYSPMSFKKGIKSEIEEYRGINRV